MEAVGKLRAYVLILLSSQSRTILKRLDLIDEEELPNIDDLHLEELENSQNFIDQVSNDLTDIEGAEVEDENLKYDLSTVFYSICMLGMKHEEEHLITHLLQSIVPNLLKYWKSKILSTSGSLDAVLNWPKSLWEMMMALTAEGEFGADETARCLMILSRTLSLFLPYSKETGVDYDKFKVINFDLRREDGIAFLLLDGLESTISMATSNALRILKSLISFSSAVSDDPETIKPESFVDEDSSTRIFVWNPKDKSRWIEVWTMFILHYESCSQPQVHILEPMLPRFSEYLERGELDAPWLGLSWWETLLTVSFKNPSMSVKKAVIEMVLTMPDSAFPSLRTASSFVFGALLELCDLSSFYFPIDTSRLASRFGEMVVKFYSRYLDSFPKEERTDTINDYVNAITSKVKGPNPAIYMMNGLLECEAFPALNESSLEALQKFASSHSTFHNASSRRLIKWLMLRIMIKLGDPGQISYRSASQAIEFLLAENEQFTIGSTDYNDMADWLESSYGVDLCEQNLLETPMEENVSRARRISVMSVLAMRTPGAFVRCCKPAYDFMASIAQHVNIPSFVVGALLLFIRLDEAVRRVSSDSTDLVAHLQLAERLFEWIDTVNQVLIGGNPELLDYYSTMILVEGQKILLSAACALEGKTSIGIIEMQLFVLLDHLQTFTHRRQSFAEETFGQQLLKIAILEMTDAYLIALEQVEFYEIGFFELKHVLQVFDLSVDRPAAAHMSPVQYGSWGDLQVSFVAAKWKLISTLARFFRHHPQLGMDVVETFERCLAALETAKYEAVPSILSCLSTLLPLLPRDAFPYDMIEESLRLCQDLLDNHHDTPKWFDSYAAAYFEYAFQPFLLGTCSEDDRLHGENGIIRSALDHAINKICPKRRGLINRVALLLYNTWTEDAHSRSLYVSVIAQLLMYGPVRDCPEERFLMTQPTSAESSSDYLSRVYMICMLIRLDKANDDDHSFAVILLNLFLDRAIHGIGMEDWEKRTVFPNAIQHRRKMRSWMASLMLQPLIRSSDDINVDDLWSALGQEALPSTRSYIEWFIARWYLAFPSKLSTLLEKLDDIDSKSAAFVVSLFTIIVQVTIHLEQFNEEFIVSVLDGLQLLFSEANYQIRTVACWAFRRIWRHYSESLKSSAPKHLSRQAARLEKPNTQVAKGIAKQEVSPTISGYDSVLDFNLRFIFYHFPNLLGMSADELITHYSFHNILQQTEGLNVPIDTPYELTSAQKPTIVKPDNEITVKPQSDADLFKDYQRKLAVWDLSMLEEDLGTFRRNRELEKRKNVLGETIVCASLVDRIPNLAGLSRTCEILGCARLTIPDAAVLDDPLFKGIAMTSDRWLQIDAVPPGQVLLSFLEARRREGFRILAVEQTSASAPLHNYTFPSRYVLVLGNENSGVPPEILHIVDDCIEIPQFGMIRSLNVHVCGSIVLWESRRQLLVKNPAALVEELHMGSPDALPPSPANTVSI